MDPINKQEFTRVARELYIQKGENAFEDEGSGQEPEELLFSEDAASAAYLSI